MRLFVIAAAVCLLPVTAQAKPKQHPHGHHHSVSDAKSHPSGHRHNRHRHPLHKRHPETAPTLPVVTKLQGELARLRQEIAEVRAQVGRPPLREPVGWQRSLVEGPLIAPPPRPIVAALSLPDLRLPVQEPANPVQMPERVVSEGVDEARAYLLKTAYPGYTMSRQGPDVALGRLHPEFARRLANAIRAARAEGIAAGVFSAYRPPAFGVGGFSDKFNSMHTYGLAVDMAGIGGPGSRTVRRFAAILVEKGLYLPYGPDNRAEYNHVQLLPSKVATDKLRHTITAQAPRDLWLMWAASGVAPVAEDKVGVEAKR